MAKQSEREIARTILKHLRANGVLCFRHEPHTFNHTLGRHISNPYDMKGAPDIIAVLPDNTGRLWGIEVKTKTGRQSPNQVLFQKRLENAGGVYTLARSIVDVEPFLSYPQVSK